MRPIEFWVASTAASRLLLGGRATGSSVHQSAQALEANLWAAHVALLQGQGGKGRGDAGSSGREPSQLKPLSGKVLQDEGLKDDAGR